MYLYAKIICGSDFMLINANNLSKSYGTDVIFENVSFELAEHDKMGFVGSNGAGKTTLLKVITGEEAPDSGNIFIGKNIKIGYMKQNSVFSSDDTVLHEMLKVFSHLTDMEKELDDIALALETGDGNRDELITRQAHLTESFKNEGGYVYKSKTRSVLLGLGFSENEFQTKINSLSGGERTRLVLARLLLENPDLLLLDEPTNHLDIQSVSWLEDYLTSYNGGLIVISHDRYFLDKITNRTMEMENGKLSCYKGNYSKYAKLKEEQNLHLSRVYENTTAEIARLKAVIEQQRRWNREKNIKTAESKQKIIDRLTRELEAPPEKQETIRFKFTPSRSSGNDVLFAENISKAFDGKRIFHSAGIDIKRRDRIFLLGANGCGKTTFLKILLGDIIPDSGSYKLGTNVDIGYYDQTGSDLNPQNTVIEEIWDAFPKLSRTEIYSALAAFLFYGDDVLKTVGSLSGGEKARVALIKLMLGGYNFLMLDEPTNHLDIASKEMLEKALLEYDGTLLIISHDRYFINKLANSICEMNTSGIKRYNGNYDYYLEKSADAEVQPATKPVNEKQTADKSYFEQKEYSKRKRKLENTVKKCEEQLEKLESEISALKAELENPVIATDYTKMLEITEKIDALTAEYDENFYKLDEVETELNNME